MTRPTIGAVIAKLGEIRETILTEWIAEAESNAATSSRRRAAAASRPRNLLTIVIARDASRFLAAAEALFAEDASRHRERGVRLPSNLTAEENAQLEAETRTRLRAYDNTWLTFYDRCLALERAMATAMQDFPSEAARRYPDLHSGQASRKYVLFAETQPTPVALLDDFVPINGHVFRTALSDPRRERDAEQAYLIAHHDELPPGAALCLLSLDPYDNLNVIAPLDHLPFGAMTAPQSLGFALDGTTEVAFAKHFNDQIERFSLHTHKWREDCVTAAIIEYFENNRTFSDEREGRHVDVELVVYKNSRPTDEPLYGDICFVLQIDGLRDETVYGICFLEAKKLHLKVRKYREIRKDQLKRLLENSNEPMLLLYDPYTTDPAWSCSTVPVNEVYKDGKLQRGAEIARLGMPFAARIVREYFWGENLTEGADAVKGAVERARDYLHGVISIRVGHGDSGTAAHERVLGIRPDLDRFLKGIMQPELRLKAEKELRGPNAGHEIEHESRQRPRQGPSLGR